MFTRLTPIGVGAAALLGLAALGGMERRVLAQGMPHGNPGFRVNQGQSMMGASGVKGHASGMGNGFNFNGMGSLPMGSYGMMTSSPSSGITSTPYSSEGTSSAYGSGYSDMPDPYGGYLKGAAEVIGAEGRYSIDTQKAFLIKERVKASQIDNRRRLFDEWMYERANTPSLQEEREKYAKYDLRRSRFDPPRTEIWSGAAMNNILEDLKRADRSKVSGGNEVIPEDVLKKINLGSGKGGVNLGILKNDGKLDWPVALRDTSLGAEGRELRQQIQSLVDAAYDTAKKNQLPDPGAIKEIRHSTRQLEQMLRRNINELGFSQYTEAKQYLQQLNDGVNLLADKNAADYINGKYTLANLKDNTVSGVVKYMQDNGLQFAPAVDGEEAAYVALHRSLANYDIATSSMIARSPQ